MCVVDRQVSSGSKMGTLRCQVKEKEAPAILPIQGQSLADGRVSEGAVADGVGPRPP
jgi:hypothetical protein